MNGIMDNVYSRVPGPMTATFFPATSVVYIGRAVFDGPDGKEKLKARVHTSPDFLQEYQACANATNPSDHDGIVFFDHITKAQNLAAEMISFFVMKRTAAANLGVGMKNNTGVPLQTANTSIDAFLGDAIAGNTKKH